MASIGKIARRTFLFGAVVVAGGAAFGAWYVSRPLANPLRPDAGETAMNAFVVIGEDGVTLIAPRAEMGQGVQTTWAALLAEELDVAWEDVRVIHGPPAAAYYNTVLGKEAVAGSSYDTSALAHNFGELVGKAGRFFDLQVTGGSTSMKDGYERLRTTGAATREALKQVAAERLGIAVPQLTTENGQVIAPDGRALPYAALAGAAVGVETPEIVLRPRSEWKYLGTSLPRVDMVAKCTGTAEFAIDVRQEGMRFAAVRRAPHRGGMHDFDSRAAERMPGVEKIVDLGDGIAVIATNTWLAQQAADAVEIRWQGASGYPSTTEAMFEATAEAFDGEVDSTLRDDGRTDTVHGYREVSAEYRVPFVAHAPMEPMTAAALIDAEGLKIWAGSQAPLFAARACAEAAGVSDDRVQFTTTYMGGAFGRRGELDFAVIATRIARAVPGTPVQVTWSREEDMTHDFYRPGAIARLRGGIAGGKAVMFDAQVSAPSVTRQVMRRWMGTAPSGPDGIIVEGLANQPYRIPNYRVRGYAADIQPPLGYWRSVGHSHNGFFHESFIDEMAHAAGADPLDFRMALTREEWEPAYGVLEAVREMSDWDGARPEGTGRGVALCYSYGTPVAVVLEVADREGRVALTRAWVAADPGVALDPRNIEAQLTGGLAFGLSAAIGEEITFARGIVEQRNFPDYEPLRITAMPEVSVRLLERQARIGGIGEVAVPPAAPALANALFDLTGERLRTLPLRHSVDFVT